MSQQQVLSSFLQSINQQSNITEVTNEINSIAKSLNDIARIYLMWAPLIKSLQEGTYLESPRSNQLIELYSNDPKGTVEKFIPDTVRYIKQDLKQLQK